MQTKKKDCPSNFLLWALLGQCNFWRVLFNQKKDSDDFNPKKFLDKCHIAKQKIFISALKEKNVLSAMHILDNQHKSMPKILLMNIKLPLKKS